MTIPAFRVHILSWYRKNGRDLPWKRTKNPYRILVSEVMLQQTQVSRVERTYRAFLRMFPSLRKLASASDADLLQAWKGLGYWRRAVALRETARRISKDHRGRIPHDPSLLQSFPGIGPYTARAVSCFAFGNSEAFLDTNIRRVYLHFFFKGKESVRDEEILSLARRAVWKRDPRTWHYALFDYGATVLKNDPANRKSASYKRQSRFQGSFRQFRAIALRRVLEGKRRKVPGKILRKELREQMRKRGAVHAPSRVLESLCRDGLLKERGGEYSV